MSAVLLYDQEYTEVTSNGRAGMYLGADYLGIPQPAVAILLSAPSTTETKEPSVYLKVMPRAFPVSGYKAIELPLRELTALRESSTPKAAFSSLFPEIAGMGLHDCLVVGPRLNEDGVTISILIATFSDRAILQGLLSFYTARNVYPASLLIYLGVGTTRWIAYAPLVPITLVSEESASTDYVAPSKFSYYFEGKPEISLVATSSDPLGWQRGELYKYLLETLFALIDPKGILSPRDLRPIGKEMYVISLDSKT